MVAFLHANVARRIPELLANFLDYSGYPLQMPY
jgi:hypothetical protein